MTEKSNTPADCKDRWRTPPEIFQALNAEFCFVLDAAAGADNSVCTRYVDEHMNTLTTEWYELMPDYTGYVWLNPPYSKPGPFLQKAAAENRNNGVGCVALLNADTSVGWFKEAIETAHEVRFITGGRLAFLSAKTGKAEAGNSKGQMLIIWHPWPRTRCEMKAIDKGELMAFGEKLIRRAA
ncbi:DNA N-6-adenine-methyltransferase [Erwinia phage phiEt88]|uniref:DNA methyltransferase n=1 Tax=Erwinia phage phiEt88 TaxID=925984 RepID=UPI0001F1FC8B|nr:DNA methyltransferase [Erwinia phage phiEt88]CBX44570.1 DNA N-6-adenine-methyltransferase [Erwinia phage phiEt88]